MFDIRQHLKSHFGAVDRLYRQASREQLEAMRANAAHEAGKHESDSPEFAAWWVVHDYAALHIRLL